MSVNPTGSSRLLVVYFLSIIFSSELLGYHSKYRFGQASKDIHHVNQSTNCFVLAYWKCPLHLVVDTEGSVCFRGSFSCLKRYLKVWIHGAILRVMAELHRVSTPKFVARNIAAVESRSTSATLRATNFFVYPPSAAFCAVVWRKFQCSANQISHSNLTADLIFARGTFHVKRWFGLQKRKVF